MWSDQRGTCTVAVRWYPACPAARRAHMSNLGPGQRRYLCRIWAPLQRFCCRACACCRVYLVLQGREVVLLRRHLLVLRLRHAVQG